jgi:hypothetical protein
MAFRNKHTHTGVDWIGTRDDAQRISQHKGIQFNYSHLINQSEWRVSVSPCRSLFTSTAAGGNDTIKKAQRHAGKYFLAKIYGDANLLTIFINRANIYAGFRSLSPSIHQMSMEMN